MRQALYLVFSLCAGSIPAETIRSINLDHTAPIPAETALTQALTAYQGQELTTESADKISALVLAHYQANDYPVVLVSVPEAAMENGALTVEVSEGRVGQLTQTGHPALAKATPRLHPGDLLTGLALQQSLDDLHRSPFHHATVAATPGAAADLADIKFELPNSAPFAAWLNFTNDGIKPLGEARWLAGLSVGDLFQTDNTLTLQGQMAEDYATYHTVLGEWKSRLPWHHEITLNAAYVQTASPPQGDISVAGEAWFANAKYTVPWRTTLSCAGESWLSMEVKHLATDVIFGGNAALQQPIDIATFTLGEKATFSHQRESLELSAEAVYSPGGLWGHSADADYGAAVHGATASFFYLRSQATWTHTWENKATLLGTVAGQWASDPLLSSEAFYLTGANAVRGYRERSLVGSTGLRASLEGRTAFVSVPHLSHTQVQALSFADAGHTWTEQALTDTPVSLGTGLRAQLGTWGQLRAEVAWPLTDNLPARLHLQMTLFF